MLKNLKNDATFVVNDPPKTEIKPMKCKSTVDQNLSSPKVMHLVIPNNLCIFGCKTKHEVQVDCPKIIGLSKTALTNIIKSSNACYKCFEKTCRFALCQSKNCSICQGSHHYKFCQDTWTNIYSEETHSENVYFLIYQKFRTNEIGK